jgi:capsular polysaccharide biosynthesis protein
MIRRIYLKSIYLVNVTLGKVLLFFERTGLLGKIDAKLFEEIPGVIDVNLPYPQNFLEKDKGLFAHYTGYETNDLAIYEFKNVNVALSGAIFRGMNNSVLSFPHPLFRLQYGWMYMLDQYWFHKKQTGEEGRTYIVLFDFWAANNYYHWLVDSLPRLLLVKELLKQQQVSLLLPETCSKFVYSTLEYFDISTVTVIKKGHFFQGKHILFPNYTAGSGHIHPEYVQSVRRHLIQKIASTIIKERVYVSRSNQKVRKIHNEQEVINTLLPLGFEILRWEELSFEQQVQTVRNTKVLVTSHGANMTNTMFMPDNSKVLEIIREDKPNFCYWALASVTDKKYYYQFCKVVNHDDLLVDIEQFKINLQKLLND